MARGLVGRWKQPVYYDFDQVMKPRIINDIVSSLYNAGYIVVAMTCDMGSGNMRFWSDLNIGYDKNCFMKHPYDDSLKIFVFADAPHLLKLARNHFVDHGFHINGKSIDKSSLEMLLTASNTELTIAHKLTRYHLDLKGSERQRVLPAAQLFSNTVSKAIEYRGEKDYYKDEGNDWKKCSEIIKLFNDWFDLFNAKSKYGCHSGCNAFGVDKENQIALLNNITPVVSATTVGKHKALIPFQKGILLSNSSLIQMYEYMASKYDMEYILTYRLNQDVLEIFFSYIRGMGGGK